MFEIIRVIVVAWIAYVVIKALFRAGSTVQRREIRKETKHIAINEFGVPETYYNLSVLSHMDEVKKAALTLTEQNDDDEYEYFNWSRFLAWAIYSRFRHDCQEYQYGNPLAQSKLEGLGILPEMIFSELDRVPEDLLNP